MELGGQSGNAGIEGAPDAGSDLNLDSLLGTSPEGEPTSGLQGGAPGQGSMPDAQASAAYKFAGRTWQSQKDAEAAWNKLYGKYSEQQGLVNALRSGDPEVLAVLAKDPKMAQILSKLGIEAARNAFPQSQGMSQNEQMSPEEIRREIVLERQMNEIMREEMRFEKRMGRDLSEREQQAVYAVLERAHDLTYEEAYFLAHRQQIMKQQAQGNAAAQGAAAQQNTGRPKPPPRSIPGTPGQGKKQVKDMSVQEWRENLRQSGIVKELMSKGASRE